MGKTEASGTLGVLREPSGKASLRRCHLSKDLEGVRELSMWRSWRNSPRPRSRVCPLVKEQ